jgi:hypothetical protein
MSFCFHFKNEFYFEFAISLTIELKDATALFANSSPVRPSYNFTCKSLSNHACSAS